MSLSNLYQSFDPLWVQVWSVMYMMDFGRYVIAAGLVYSLLWLVLRQRLAHRKIQPGKPELRQMLMEFRYSALTVVIYATIGLGLYFGAQAGIFKLIPEFRSGDTGYLIGSTLLMILMHDTYFYWAHRLMHHPRLYRWVHWRHHLSHRPTPWAAYSFSPAEAVVEAGFAPLFLLFVPMHELGMFLWVSYQIILNTMGHSGIEIFPRGWVGNRWLDWHQTITHHDLHHSRFRYNYGLYFTWWDRLMGTENPDYARRFNEVTRTQPISAANADEKIRL